MTIDISKIKPGDKVTLVPLEVKNVDDAKGYIRVHPVGSMSIYVKSNQIAAHHPAPREFQVGDRVKMKENPPGKVIGIDDGWIYVLWPHNTGAMRFRPSDLTLVEAGQ